MRLAISDFTVMGLLSRLCLANPSDSGSFLLVHASLRQDGLQRGEFWEVVRAYGLVPPFDLSCILLVVGGLLILHSLPGPLVK